MGLAKRRDGFGKSSTFIPDCPGKPRPRRASGVRLDSDAVSSTAELERLFALPAGCVRDGPGGDCIERGSASDESPPTALQMSTEDDSPIATVKRATSDAHRRVEDVITGRFFERSEFDRSDFRELLATYYGLYNPLETVLGPASDAYLEAFQYRLRAPRIAEDLRTIGCTERDIQRLPALERARLVEPGSLHELLGALYVVEGAALGNRVIRRMLEPMLGGLISRAGSFFHDDAVATGERWERFRSVFNRRVDSEEALRVAVRVARATFVSYQEWFHERA